MDLIKIITTLTAIFLLGCSRADSGVNVTTIDIHYSDFPGFPITNIFINENGPYPFLIDTGSTSSSMSSVVAAKIGLNEDLSLIHI